MDVETQAPWKSAERAGCAVIAAAFALSLVSSSMAWDWLMDTLFLAIAGLLAFPGDAGIRGVERAADARLPFAAAGWPRLACTYLCVDAAFLAAAGLRTGATYVVLPYGVLAGLYGYALRLRLQASTVGSTASPIPGSGPAATGAPGSFTNTLFAPAVRLRALLCLLALLCLFLPMSTRSMGFTAWSGPMVVNLPGTVSMNAGHTVRIGGNYAAYGFALPFGHPAALLLLASLLWPWLQSRGIVSPDRGRQLLRWSPLALLLWWLLPARGLQSLVYPATLMFVVAVGMLAFFSLRGFAASTS